MIKVKVFISYNNNIFNNNIFFNYFFYDFFSERKTNSM